MSSSPTTRVDHEIARLVESGLVEPSQLIGCSPSDIQSIEEAYSLKLPAAYRHFLARLGRSAGGFMEGTDFLFADRVDLLHQRRFAEELLREGADRFELAAHDYVFMSHQGYQFFYFSCDGSDDPPVGYYLEGDAQPRRVSESFSDWLTECVDDEITPRVADR